MTPETKGTGPVEASPRTPRPEIIHRAPGRDRVLLVTPPYYHVRPVCRADLATVMTARTAREGAVVVWEMAPDQGRSPLAEAVFAALRRRPATLPLVVIRPDAETHPDRSPSRMWEACIEALRPLAVLPGPPDGRTDEIQRLLRARPPDLPSEIVELVIRRGVVMNADLQRIVGVILREGLSSTTAHGTRFVMGPTQSEVDPFFAHAGIPDPLRWMRLRRVLDFVIAYGSGERTLDEAAFDIGETDPQNLVEHLRDLTGVGPEQIRARLGWRWVLEAWIRKEVIHGGFSDDQRDRIVMMGRGPDNAVRCSECGSDRVNRYWDADA